ncbi:Nitroreductase-like protein, partial [Roridomyces roridus]
VYPVFSFPFPSHTCLKVYCLSGDLKDTIAQAPEAYSAQYHYYPPALSLRCMPGYLFRWLFKSHHSPGSWLDVGYFLQSMTLAARARGLETISQEATAKYQLILRKHLPIDDTEIVALGMCMGYPDLEKVAQFSAKQPKREVSDIVEFFGF